jgi:2-methylisocitrate lyase-like PEP mutase family enzyme
VIKTENENSSRQKQLEKIEIFRQLHRPDDPIVLYNIWDAGSARAVAKSGARAIATSSWAVAKSRGFNDGQQLPLELAIQNLRQIVEAVDLPVTFDIESAYAEEPDEVGRNIVLAVDAGAVGCNFEDSIPGNGAVRDSATQVKRIRGARQAARVRDVPFFINARCDLFFHGDVLPHNERLLEHVLDRAYAYADAGADGLFVPGLASIPLIAKLTEKSPLPVNILAGPTTSLKVLAENGVSRVSYGASPYVASLAALEQAAAAVAQ